MATPRLGQGLQPPQWDYSRFYFRQSSVKLGHKIDMRILVTISFMVYALTFYWRAVTFEPGMTFADVALPQFVQGLAVACFFMPLTTITLSGLPPEKWLRRRVYLISFEPLLAR